MVFEVVLIDATEILVQRPKKNRRNGIAVKKSLFQSLALVEIMVIRVFAKNVKRKDIDYSQTLNHSKQELRYVPVVVKKKT